jgi:phosphatidylglycerol phospholipase C
LEQPQHIKVCLELLPGFSTGYIGANLSYARALMTSVPKLNFNMYYASLVGPFGSSFMRRARKEGRLVWAWTVDDEDWMEWCIKKGLDGVITDDPKRYLEMCERWRKGEKLRARLGLVNYLGRFFGVIRAHLMMWLYAFITFRKNGWPRKHVRQVFSGR